MVAVFEKPFSTVTLADVMELKTLAWPENYTVEYKRSLPEKNGGKDDWDLGKGKIGAYARDEILAEVIAFANADGGILIIGMDETDDDPHRAKDIVPVPNVRDLGGRFEDVIRTCIDPPLSMVQVQPVETAGGNGILLIKVSSSRAAPHRLSTTREAFVRRGTSTAKMNMRDVQEMTVNKRDRATGVLREFSDQREQFSNWSGSPYPPLPPIGFGITALPLDHLPQAPRLFNSSSFHFHIRNFNARIGTLPPVQLFFSHVESGRETPVLRGVAMETQDPNSRYRIEATQTGRITLWYARDPIATTGTRGLRLFHHGWLLGGVANVLLCLQKHRIQVGMPDAEYGLEVMLVFEWRTGLVQDPPIEYVLMDNSSSYEVPYGRRILPILSVGPAIEFDTVISTIDVDVQDILGVRRTTHDQIRVQW